MKEIIYSYTYVSHSESSGAMITTKIQVPIGGTFFYNGDTYLVIESCGNGVDFIAKRL
jgi:hypothetical protein